MALVKYTGDDVRRAYGVEMKQGDTHEFTQEQAAHLTRLAEFVVVGDADGKVVPKAKPIGTRKGKKK